MEFLNYYSWVNFWQTLAEIFERFSEKKNSIRISEYITEGISGKRMEKFLKKLFEKYVKQHTQDCLKYYFAYVSEGILLGISESIN